MTTQPVLPGLASLARLRGVRGVLITSLDDALTIESTAHVDVDVEALAVFATTLYRRAHQAAEAAEAGEVRVISLEADAGRLAASARGRLLLVVIAERETNPGLLRVALQRAWEGLS